MFYSDLIVDFQIILRQP